MFKIVYLQQMEEIPSLEVAVARARVISREYEKEEVSIHDTKGPEGHSWFVYCFKGGKLVDTNNNYFYEIKPKRYIVKFNDNIFYDSNLNDALRRALELSEEDTGVTFDVYDHNGPSNKEWLVYQVKDADLIFKNYKYGTYASVKLVPKSKIELRKKLINELIVEGVFDPSKHKGWFDFF